MTKINTLKKATYIGLKALPIIALLYFFQYKWDLFRRIYFVYVSIYQGLSIPFKTFPIAALIIMIVIPQVFILWYACIYFTKKYTTLFDWLLIRIIDLSSLIKFKLESGFNRYLPAKATSYKQGFLRNFLFFLTYFFLFVAAYFFLEIKLPSQSFFETQLVLSHLLVIIIYLHIAITIYIHRLNILPFLNSLIFSPVPPFLLAFFRIIFFTAIIVLYKFQYDSSSLITLYNSHKGSIPFGEWFLPFIPAKVETYNLIYYLGIVCSLLSAVGFLYRYIAWLNIFFAFYLIGVPMYFGVICTVHIWFWICCFMVFLPASDVYSVDSLIRKIRGHQKTYQARYKYGIVFNLMWIQFGIIYFFPGIWKLWDTGLSWALGQNMINQIELEWLQNYYKIPYLRPDHFPFITHCLGLCAIVIELSVSFLLLNKNFRTIAIFLLISLHSFAGYFMYLPFPDLEFFLVFAFLSNTMISPNNQHDPKPKNTKALNWNLRITMVSGIFILSMNIVFGFFGIKSWPFTIYPKHSSNVGETFERIEFEIPEANLDRFKIDSIGKKNHFDKDHYYILSDYIIGYNKTNDSVQTQKTIQTLWINWQTGNPELKQYNHPHAFVLETYIDPAKRYFDLKKSSISF